MCGLQQKTFCINQVDRTLVNVFFCKYSETLILFITPFLHLLARFILEPIPQTVSVSLVT